MRAKYISVPRLNELMHRGAIILSGCVATAETFCTPVICEGGGLFHNSYVLSHLLVRQHKVRFSGVYFTCYFTAILTTQASSHE
eukprot:784274-Pleurochrysis_carterae.AAC.1